MQFRDRLRQYDESECSESVNYICGCAHVYKHRFGGWGTCKCTKKYGDNWIMQLIPFFVLSFLDCSFLSKRFKEIVLIALLFKDCSDIKMFWLHTDRGTNWLCFLIQFENALFWQNQELLADVYSSAEEGKLAVWFIYPLTVYAVHFLYGAHFFWPIKVCSARLSCFSDLNTWCMMWLILASGYGCKFDVRVESRCLCLQN